MCSSIEHTEFHQCKHILSRQVTLVYIDACQRFCIYTEACHDPWSGIATQVPLVDVPQAHMDQRHPPLVFFSVIFTAAQMQWDILEKEGYTIMATLERLHWLDAIPSFFDLYPDHHNLIFILYPLSFLPDLAAPGIREVLRWAVRLRIYNYDCMHIRGEDNVWADILERWATPPIVRRFLLILHYAQRKQKTFHGPDWIKLPVYSRSMLKKD